MKKNKPIRDYRRLHAICRTHGFDYKDKVYEFTRGRTESLSSLSDKEYQELLLQLIRLNAPARAAYNKQNEIKPKPGDKMRKAMIDMAHDMNWGNGDIERIKIELSDWCLKQKYKKPFMAHSPDEYALLVTIFRNKVYSNFFRDLHK